MRPPRRRRLAAALTRNGKGVSWQTGIVGDTWQSGVFGFVIGGQTAWCVDGADRLATNKECKLLHKEGSKRLGSSPGGSDEIKKHKWFKPINWKKLDGRQIQPSFLPNVSGLRCITNFDECWTNIPVLDSPVGVGHPCCRRRQAQQLRVVHLHQTRAVPPGG
ncbi:hypothetical protein ABZP36_001413 [Zizania latifolia]